MLAGAHLVGHAAVKRFLDSGGAIVERDGNGVPVTDYMRKFAGYDFIFDNNRKAFDGAYDGRPGDPIPIRYLNPTQSARQLLDS
jgi:hypothetical protein